MFYLRTYMYNKNKSAPGKVIDISPRPLFLRKHHFQSLTLFFFRAVILNSKSFIRAGINFRTVYVYYGVHNSSLGLDIRRQLNRESSRVVRRFVLNDGGRTDRGGNYWSGSGWWVNVVARNRLVWVKVTEVRSPSDTSSLYRSQKRWHGRRSPEVVSETKKEQKILTCWHYDRVYMSESVRYIH